MTKKPEYKRRKTLFPSPFSPTANGAPISRLGEAFSPVRPLLRPHCARCRCCPFMLCVLSWPVGRIGGRRGMERCGKWMASRRRASGHCCHHGRGKRRIGKQEERGLFGRALVRKKGKKRSEQKTLSLSLPAKCWEIVDASRQEEEKRGEKGGGRRKESAGQSEERASSLCIQGGEEGSFPTFNGRLSSSSLFDSLCCEHLRKRKVERSIFLFFSFRGGR